MTLEERWIRWLERRGLIWAGDDTRIAALWFFSGVALVVGIVLVVVLGK